VANFDVRSANLIPRNSGEGSNFFALNLRVSRSFPLTQGVRAEGAVEAFNVTNRRNDLTRVANFGAGSFPTSPAPTFNTVTAVADPRAVQLAVRLRF
jgi:hypothetical protein